MALSGWSTTKYLSRAIAEPVFPFSVSILAKASAISARHAAVVLYGGAGEYFRLGFRNVVGTLNAQIVSRSAAAGQVEREGATAVVTGTWYSLIGVWYAADDWRLYLDGVEDGASTTSVTPTGVATVYVGTEPGGNAFAGALAEVGIWRAALTAGARAALARRVIPPMVQFKDLVDCFAIKPAWHGLFSHVSHSPIVMTGALTGDVHPTTERRRSDL